MTWPKCVVIFIALFGLYGAEFLYFLLPNADLWLVMAGLVCWIPLFVFSLVALFRRRWKLVSIFRRVGVAFPCRSRRLGTAPLAKGPRLHLGTLLNKEFLPKCRLWEFVENGTTQAVGYCGGHDRGNFFDYIVYDTTNEFTLPVSQRSSEWKRLIGKASEQGVESREQPTYHLFGNFYATSVAIYELGPEQSRD